MNILTTIRRECPQDDSRFPQVLRAQPCLRFFASIGIVAAGMLDHIVSLVGHKSAFDKLKASVDHQCNEFQSKPTRLETKPRQLQTSCGGGIWFQIDAVLNEAWSSE